jgi:hypothetical protein
MFRSSSQSDLPPVKFNFKLLLRLTRQFEVTDPRDRLYGRLTITTDDNNLERGELFTKPDYTIKPDELRTSTAVKGMIVTNDLSLLSCVQYQTDKLVNDSSRRPSSGYKGRFTLHFQKKTLPSWMPQWDHVFQATISSWDGAEAFSTSKGLPQPLVDHSHRTL